MIPAFIFGAASGAHFNPALTIALAVDGSLAWGLVPGYLIAQFAGAILGAVIVYVMFKDQFDATDDPFTKRGVFCTAPSSKNIPINAFTEIVATFVLVFSIKGIGQVAGIAGGVSNLLVCGIIISIGMSLGGLTGYALNPARDIGPRIAHAFLPIKNKAPSEWGYAAIVTLVSPIIGALIAVGLYAIIPW